MAYPPEIERLLKRRLGGGGMEDCFVLSALSPDCRQDAGSTLAGMQSIQRKRRNVFGETPRTFLNAREKWN